MKYLVFIFSFLLFSAIANAIPRGGPPPRQNSTPPTVPAPKPQVEVATVSYACIVTIPDTPDMAALKKAIAGYDTVSHHKKSRSKHELEQTLRGATNTANWAWVRANRPDCAPDDVLMKLVRMGCKDQAGSTMDVWNNRGGNLWEIKINIATSNCYIPQSDACVNRGAKDLYLQSIKNSTGHNIHVCECTTLPVSICRPQGGVKMHTKY